MSTKTGELAKECRRQEESCLYTATSFFYWIRFLQIVKVLFITLPLILGSIGGWKLLETTTAVQGQTVAAVCSFLAGLMSTIYAALKIEDTLVLCRKVAGDFKNLQDAFRMAALVSSKKSFDVFEKDVRPLIERLEAARSHSIIVPGWCFWAARRKIRGGHYDFSVDLEMKDL